MPRLCLCSPSPPLLTLTASDYFPAPSQDPGSLNLAASPSSHAHALPLRPSRHTRLTPSPALLAPKTWHLSNACRQTGLRVRQQPLRVATCWSCACPGCLLIRCNASLRSNCDSCNPSMRPYVSNACLCTIAWSMRVHTNYGMRVCTSLRAS